LLSLSFLLLGFDPSVDVEVISLSFAPLLSLSLLLSTFFLFLPVSSSLSVVNNGVKRIHTLIFMAIIPVGRGKGRQRRERGEKGDREERERKKGRMR
jgi:hypothetical protein